MTERLSRIFPYLLLVPAVLPLVYISGVVYPYITPKTFLLQGSGIIALGVFVHLALSGRSFYYGRLRNKLSWIPLALLLVAYVASIFGIDFYHSFWGLFDRGDGLLTLTVITTFFYLILLYADKEFYERIIKIVAIVAGIVATVAVLQGFTTILGAKASFLPPVTGRIGSTFGNAAFLAGYLGMALFVILIALRDVSGLWRTIYKVSAVLSVLAIFFAATRGTIVALIFAGVVALIFATLNGDKKVKKTASYGLIALVVLAGLFFVFRAELSQSPIEPIQRIASISFSDGTVSSRLFVWQNIGEEALKRPWSGYGGESMASLFNRVYDPSKIVEQWFDRSHNAYLDYFAQYGIFGLLLYLSLISAFLVSAFRIYKREKFGLLNTGFLLLLLIFTYSVQNFFVFDTPHSLWLLYALFSVVLILASDVQVKPQSFRRLPILGNIIAVIIFLTIIPLVGVPLYANIMLTKGYLYHLTDVNRANAYFNRGLSLGTYADVEYGYQAYDIYTERQATMLKGSDRIAAYEYALSTLKTNLERYSYDARTATYLGHVMDTAPPEVTVDEDFLRETLNKAIELSPLRAQAWYMTANISLRKADSLPIGSKERVSSYREAIKVLETYVEKEPTLPVPQFILATIYYALGDTVTAKKWADGALPLYESKDTAAARPAVKYYIAISDWQNAVRFLADLVEEDPNDYDVLYDLAKVTYLAGDPATSLRIVEKIRNENPSLLETDQNFLKAITTYEQSKK